MDDGKKQRRLLSLYRVRPHFQLKFSLVIFFFLSSVALFVYIQGSLAIQSMLASKAISSADSIAQLRFLNGVVAKTFIIGLAVSFGLSLFFSHFVAGPIYRFERVLKEMRDGRLDINVKLRKHDELKHIAELFNDALASLRERLRREREGNPPEIQI